MQLDKQISLLSTAQTFCKCRNVSEFAHTRQSSRDFAAHIAHGKVSTSCDCGKSLGLESPGLILCAQAPPDGNEKY